MVFLSETGKVSGWLGQTTSILLLRSVDIVCWYKSCDMILLDILGKSGDFKISIRNQEWEKKVGNYLHG